MRISFRLTSILILASSLLSSCLVKRTVTTGGQEVESGYAIKRPIKEAIDNSKKR
ncbi:hypothetical protein [Haloferula rosea]|uniref:Lipoprotein n=1 Tax=Haloferula rosea TaxID=490093 RepID=A0A934RHR4_9BACT|nr:hypothetical protein [Haloferula rosea]MBK1828540.1 hypothetical protein [Haloferula rosea]